MARRNKGFTGPKIGLFMSTALASVVLAGCTASAPPAETSFAKAQAALEDGKVDRAITHAEAAVLAEPRNAGYRAVLGAAYLEAGRFQSAATAFGEAMELGESDARTVLSYALAEIAQGNKAAALAALSENQSIIPVADFGLALALAGQPEQGVHYLVNSVRNGDASAKVRQNLAYTYALAGNWRAARVMAAEDVPADQLDARLSEWAATARAEDHQVRVANLLGVTPASDGGQPQYLALSNFPSQQMMVAEAQDMRAAEVNADVAPQVASSGPVETIALAARAAGSVPADDEVVSSVTPRASEELAFGVRDSEPAAQPDSAPRPAANARVAAASAASSTASPSSAARRFVSNAVVQQFPERSSEAPAPARNQRAAPQRRMAVATGSAATHLVQLGAFESRAVAQDKQREFQSRFPDLAKRDFVITEAVVNGRTFFRLAAAGFGNRSARSMCNTLKASGRGCFAYAASSPPAGAVDRGVRIASR
ncbi:SPOR domain-containing protein [Qipengyuania nanhaisediminis]|uniref:SPOR domain-containing protein n=1 Tax=Qipengyuania nanhaisediminis TaxID=604088 RepID=UPI0038B40576